MYFYSESAGGWFDEFHEEKPKDCVKVTNKKYTEIREAMENGHLVVMQDGQPTTVAQFTQEQLDQIEINNTARNYLSATDWYVTRSQETGDAIPDDVVAARAKARSSVVEV